MSRMSLVVSFQLCALLAACGKPPQKSPGYISRADLLDKWPLTVDEGELSCAANSSGILFTHDRKTYAVNGMAKTLGYPPIDPIWRTAPLDSVPADKVVARLSEDERRKVFHDMLTCDDGTRTDRMVPAEKYRTRTELLRTNEQEVKLTEGCKALVRRSMNLTQQEGSLISAEGSTKSWPPLTPTRKNIGPLIERGHLLCNK